MPSSENKCKILQADTEKVSTENLRFALKWIPTMHKENSTHRFVFWGESELLQTPPFPLRDVVQDPANA